MLLGTNGSFGLEIDQKLDYVLIHSCFMDKSKGGATCNMKGSSV